MLQIFCTLINSSHLTIFSILRKIWNERKINLKIKITNLMINNIEIYIPILYLITDIIQILPNIYIHLKTKIGSK